MKKLSILALVLAFTMMLSVVSFAAAPAFKLDTRENVTVPETTDVEFGSDNIVVTTPATKDAYYGVLLINGDTLPTVDDKILYIDQKTATGDSVEFTVLPILPENDITKDLTLYISSNASGEGLITVPVAYGVDAPANDYITSADTTKGTIAVDKANVTDAKMGAAKDNAIVQLALDTTAYPAAGAATAGYIVKAVNADGTDVAGSNVYYSAERKKYVAVIPSTVADYKFEVLAADAEGATTNGVIKMYGDMTEDGAIANKLPDYAQFMLVYKGATNSPAVSNAKKALIADVSGDAQVTLPDYAQFMRAYKGQTYSFVVTTK